MVDEASRQAAVDAVVAAEGAVGVLVNNAGYSQSGAVESVPDDRVRDQFETNVFGPLALCRLVLPGMREQGWGKIVQLSSMGGKLTFPGGGLYHATKHAIEAISDALRFEVKSFGVDVIVIEPGLIASGFSDAVVRGLDAASAAEGPTRSSTARSAKPRATSTRRAAFEARRSSGGGGRAHRGSAQRQAPPRALHGHPVGARTAQPPRGPARSRMGRRGGSVVPATGKKLR